MLRRLKQVFGPAVAAEAGEPCAAGDEPSWCVRLPAMVPSLLAVSAALQCSSRWLFACLQELEPTPGARRRTAANCQSLAQTGTSWLAGL